MVSNIISNTKEEVKMFLRMYNNKGTLYEAFLEICGEGMEIKQILL